MQETPTFHVFSKDKFKFCAVQRNNRKGLATMIAGGRHGADGIGGDEVVLAESGEPFLHLSDQFVDGVLLLPSAQRHALHTHTHTHTEKQCFFLKYFHQRSTKVFWTNVLTDQWAQWRIWIQPCLLLGSLDHVVDGFEAFVHPNQLQIYTHTHKIFQFFTFLAFVSITKPPNSFHSSIFPSLPSFLHLSNPNYLHPCFCSPSGWWTVPPSLPGSFHLLPPTGLWSGSLHWRNKTGNTWHAVQEKKKPKTNMRLLWYINSQMLFVLKCKKIKKSSQKDTHIFIYSHGCCETDSAPQHVRERRFITRHTKGASSSPCQEKSVVNMKLFQYRLVA